MNLPSEFHPLQQVIVHTPGPEWEMVPLESDMAESYLVEDILFLKKAAAEHTEFVACLRHIAGVDGIHQFSDLLTEILSDDKVRSDIVGAVSALEGVGLKTHDFLLSSDLSTKDLAAILISGSDGEAKSRRRYFRPIPNLMFTRDVGAFTGRTVILAHPAKRVRLREGLLAQYIFRYHRLFAETQIIDILDDAAANTSGEDVHIEGGDVMALDSETLVVGTGQRTTKLAVELLAQRLLSEGIIKRLIMVELPAERATMHLDTVFTVIGPEDCVYFPPLFSEDDTTTKPARALTYELVSGQAKVTHDSSPGGLFSALERIGYSFPNRFKCGGDSPLFQSREQWTDGANLFAARKTVAFIYERNTETIAAFEEAGYNIVTPAEFIKLDPSTVEKTLVSVNGAELSRGRGGARCMTMPISRQS
ncbi:hypothetical protein JYU19_00705 [bacterium AH-315-J21]|nr:hypothetical protein [bacterium AH-315-J21]